MNQMKPLLVTLSLSILSQGLLAPAAKATPNYARQTGLSCTVCHNGVYPQLTAFGRNFKLNAFTFTTQKTIDDLGKPEQGRTPQLKLLSEAPLGGMIQMSYTREKTAEPGAKNSNFEFPQQLSLFYAGQIAPHIGSFIQMTYSQATGTIGMDNSEIRYSNTTTKIGGKTLVYGMTLNNNPGVEDLWNSTAAWRYPYSSSSYAPTPAASTMLEGALAQQVVGAGIYGMYNNLIYGDVSAYTSAQQGVANPQGANATMLIKGMAPYGRVAFQHQFAWKKSYLEIGASGMSANFYPTGTSGATDRFIDKGVDAQYEVFLPKASLVVHMQVINEQQKLDATYASGGSEHPTNSLTTTSANAEVMFKNGVNATLGCFNVQGSSDANRYAPGVLSGFAANSPNSTGISAEIGYLLRKNVSISLNYVYYDKFNGGTTNYDGSGRNAADNNTAYVCIWIAY